MSRINGPASFKRTLGWTFVALMIVFLILRLAVFEPQREASFKQALIEANSATLAQLSDALATPILQRKFAALYALLDTQLEKRSWRGLRVINAEGRQIYPLEETPQRLSADEIQLQQDILIENKVLGRLELVLNFEYEMAQFKQNVYISESIQALLIALCLIWMFFYHRRHIENPIDQLAEAMVELTLHNFNHPLPHAKYREIADLVNVFARTRVDVEAFQQKLLELKLEADRANDAKSQFLSSMSHELRTPLNAIMGFTDLLKIDPEQRLGHAERDYLEHIGRSGRVLLELINQLLDLAQIESGKHELHIEQVNTAELIQECVQMVQPVAQRRNVFVVSTDDSCKNALVLADHRRVRQIILNLLSNGIKYSRDTPGALVAVSCEQVDGSKIRVEVEDNGLGIEQEDQQYLFQRFERLSAVNSNIEGTGIGLFICKQLVEAMGGTIGVTSKPNEGSCFWFELPQANQPSIGKDVRTQTDVESFAPRALGPEFTLLYIDDSHVNLRLIEALITTHTNITIRTSDKPLQGLEMALDDPPSVILLDLMMPEMSGFDVLRRLRADKRTRHLPVIAYTANAMNATQQEIMEAGFNDVLTKPVSMGLLLTTLEKHLLTQQNIS